jgi:AbrB family looped-hinge helix DNA binding protein
MDLTGTDGWTTTTAGPDATWDTAEKSFRRSYGRLGRSVTSCASQESDTKTIRGQRLFSYHFCAILRGMKTTIDAAGRIVVPKAMRQALGLKPGQLVDIRAGDGRLEIEIAPTPMRLKKRGEGVVAVPDAALPPLTAEQVRDTLEHVRR